MQLKITAKEAKAISDNYDIRKPDAFYNRCLSQIMATALSGGGELESECHFDVVSPADFRLVSKIIRVTRARLKRQGFKITITAPHRYSDEPDLAVTNIRIRT